ncbi:MAG: hypothetical protein JW904_13185 [Spirochaetales bacterium]|nr:hypothetical protein [Spirochaetales bacterium]
MKRLLLSLIVLFAFGGFLFAQDTASHEVQLTVAEVCLIDLNDPALITLETTIPANGGEDPAGESNTDKYLQYTSLVPSGQTRAISIAWDVADSAPAGTALLLEAIAVPANCGTAAGQITVSSSGQNLITGIGSCATGTGATTGAQLQYDLSITDVTQLNVGDTSTVTIYFTLTTAS